MIAKALIKIVAICIFIYSLLLVLGSILYGINIFYGLETIKPFYFVQPPYYILLLTSAVGILKAKKWAINLLFVLLAFNMLFLLSTGYYQGLMNVILSHSKDRLAMVIGFILFFWHTLVMPIFLFIFFSLPQIRTEFGNKPALTEP